MREATAATAQLEQAKRMIDEDERELATIGQRLVEANRIVTEREGTATDLETAQTQARDSLAADQKDLEQRLNDARQSREEKAKAVPRSLLSRYDRIRSRKRIHAVFPLRGHSCGNCDTMLPLQRRSVMIGTGATEICEGCGVMLYASE
jgi:predicted  nucleic acid-binding Zn-ribbon protein